MIVEIGPKAPLPRHRGEASTREGAGRPTAVTSCRNGKVCRLTATCRPGHGPPKPVQERRLGIRYFVARFLLRVTQASRFAGVSASSSVTSFGKRTLSL